MSSTTVGNTTQRVMTSTIENVVIAETRKNLHQARESWRAHSPDSPICLAENLSNGMRLQHFAHLFVQGHHKRRTAKATGKKRKEI